MKTKVKETNRLAGLTSENGADKIITSTITPPRVEIIHATIRGVAPFVQLKFSQKSKAKMMATMAEGGAAKNKKNRAARDYKADYEAAIHRDKDGKPGIPAAAFRNAMISACRMVNFKMTIAKMSVFILADANDCEDGTPLVWIEGEPHSVEHTVRNATGSCDVRIRAMWDEWKVNLRIKYDQDQFARQDVINLLMRAGLHVGVGEGRPDSKMSAGMGWGQFEIEDEGNK